MGGTAQTTAEAASAHLRALENPQVNNGGELKPPPPAVPGREKQLLSAIIFDISSILLLLEFLALHCTAYSNQSQCKWATPDFINWTGALEGVGWVVGFVLLIDWLVFDTFSVWGPSRRGLAGATLKLIASCFFCVQPFSSIEWNQRGHIYGEPIPTAWAYGVPWSNFVGIICAASGRSNRMPPPPSAARGASSEASVCAAPASSNRAACAIRGSRRGGYSGSTRCRTTCPPTP